MHAPGQHQQPCLGFQFRKCPSAVQAVGTSDLRDKHRPGQQPAPWAKPRRLLGTSPHTHTHSVRHKYPRVRPYCTPIAPWTQPVSNVKDLDALTGLGPHHHLGRQAYKTVGNQRHCPISGLLLSTNATAPISGLLLSSNAEELPCLAHKPLVPCCGAHHLPPSLHKDRCCS